MYNFFAYMARMKYITRWSLMRNSVSENIQEHSHMVAVLAHALAVIRREVFGGIADPEACACAALFHDATEIFTGDLPTPIKYFDPEIRSAYHRVEDAAAEKLLDLLPEELRGAYEPLLREEDGEVRTLVKAADKLAAYIKCVEERTAGNREFADAEAQTLQTLRDMALPEVEYFLEHFGESFGLTLDELIAAACKEDPLCIEIVEEIGQKLGKQIAGLINIFNPELVIIGGTLSLTGDYITQPIKTAIRKYSLNLVNKDSIIMTSKLKDKAGIIGACMLARSRMFEG